MADINDKLIGLLSGCSLDTDEDVQYVADKLIAADVAPVVHGRWIKTDNGVRENFNTGEAIRVYLHDCSVCGWHTGNQARDFNYCPNCGAHMKDGE